MTLDSTTRWCDAITHWTAHLTAAGQPTTTVSLRRYHLARLARDHEALTPAAITSIELVTWAASHEWSRETRRSHRSSLRGFFAWARRTGIRADNPAEALDSIRPEQPRPRPASRTAIHAALHDAAPRERLAIRLAAENGLRRGEIVQVHSRDLTEDLLGWTLLVHGKGGRERLAPLSTGLARDIADACERGGGWAFPGRIDGHLAPATLSRTVGQLLPEGTSMHALRHAFATTAYGASGDLLAVQQLLGHASPATTQRYVRLDQERLRRVAASAGGAIAA